MGKRVYISGTITGTCDYMYRFYQAEAYLKSKGYEVINPAFINSWLPDDSTHEEYMIVSMALLKICDTIYMLDGWQESKGAMMEAEYAIFSGYEFWEQNKTVEAIE